MAIISTTRPSRPNIFGGKVKGDDSWLDLLTVDVIRADGKYNARTVTGVWVSVGASYGPQVEFKSEALADAFVAAHPETSRRATGTRAARIVADDAVTFVAAYNAAVGGKEDAPKEVAVGALVAPSFDKTEEVLPLLEALDARTADDAALWAEFQAWKAFKAAQKK